MTTFLQDTLDSLFNILMQNPETSNYDKLVFDSLVFIIGLISDRKYQHFRPVLDLYIKETFSATLAYDKLLSVLKQYVDNVCHNETQETLYRAMKCQEYIFRFIVRSRQLYVALEEGKDQQAFESSLLQLLDSLTKVMVLTSDSTLLPQGACLKYFPFAIPDILSVFDPLTLSHLITRLINNLSQDRLTKQKMMCVNDIVHSDLFKMPNCRAVLMPVFHDLLRELLTNGEEEELCTRIMSDELVVLHHRSADITAGDIAMLTHGLLRTVIQAVISALQRDQAVRLPPRPVRIPPQGNLVAVMLNIFRLMAPFHYQKYMDSFPTNTDLLDFLMEILLVFRDLVNKSVFPRDWSEMILLQNSIILKALKFFSETIRSKFNDPFECQVWNNFFHCAVAFMTQESLQLENFTENKRNKILVQYKDMRREAGFMIRNLWFHLGEDKHKFVPGMVGPFLEMTLIPQPELRKATIPIFFDMMNCEYYSSGNFSQFENEMITQLDMLVEGGRGDEQYQELFYETFKNLCINHPQLGKEGMRFVRIVAQLLERLLQYRTIITDENKDNRMNCTVSLLEFYNEINRKELYIRYLYKLCDLHLECENFVEAAFALKLHTNLLQWSDEPLPQILRNKKHAKCETHRQLKERLYLDIIDLFDKGKLWEAGLDLCKELAGQYENEMFDYIQLSNLLCRMSSFYDNIMKQIRPEPEYFRVGYYGKGFPAFLQNKEFVYRGKAYERLSEFSSRLLNHFPLAQLMNRLSTPMADIMESSGQYIQINKVDPIMKTQAKFANKALHEQILNYYRVNEVHMFNFSRPFRKERESTIAPENEFATMWLERTTLTISHPLPGILHWFPVTSMTRKEISPIETAIEAMESHNAKIKHAVKQHQKDLSLPINPLSMLLKGIVDAAVMGGISNYEKIPLLEAGILVHKEKAPESLLLFHEHLEDAFMKLKTHVEEKYGRQNMPSDLLGTRTMASTKRAKSLTANSEPLTSNAPKTPSTTRAQSIFVRPQSTTKTLTKKKDSTASQRRSSGVSLVSSHQGELQESQSKWYDGGLLSSPNHIIELSENLTAHRPLRSEVEKRSRPPSGHFRQRLSIDSPPAAPEENQPPPLPVKQSFADYTNLPDDTGLRRSTLTKSFKPKAPDPMPDPSEATIPENNSPDDVPPELPKKPHRIATP
ncbi:DOCK2, partial [Cordylochernes scorpioides]